MNYREKFKNLLITKNINRPKESLLSELDKLHNTAILTASTGDEARYCYEWVQRFFQQSN